MQKIVDEFTDLPVSRQRKWALRKHKEKKCIICGKDRVVAFYCEFHRKDSNARTLKSKIKSKIGKMGKK